jgi:hypothetical protein
MFNLKDIHQYLKLNSFKAHGKIACSLKNLREIGISKQFLLLLSSVLGISYENKFAEVLIPPTFAAPLRETEREKETERD